MRLCWPHHLASVTLFLILAPLAVSVQADEPAFTDAQLTFFETKIRPVLADNCYSCHSHEAKKNKGGFYLDSRKGILDAVLAEPGKPDESMLIEAVRYENPDYAMPPKGKLPDAVIKDLEKWVEMGMPWPKESGPKGAAVFDLEARKASHWAWSMPKKVDPLPPVAGLDDDANVIDRFIESRLAEAGLEPGPMADRATLIRRVTLDLTGLPATAQEIEAFVADPSPQAYEHLVDRLLKSPRFGEKWARHWLDLVRYAESYGHEFDYNIPHAWKYRDYVIRALNDDVPYDRFVREHIAGDLIEPRVHPDTKVNEAVKATGWWYMHEQTHSPTDVRQHESDRFDNQIDVLSKTFMGMTVACARCHDHKFDAISDEDYYSLVGYLQSSRQDEAYLDPAGQIERTLEQVRKIREAGQADFASLNLPHAKASVIDHDATTLFEDFNAGSFNGWRTTGWAWEDGPTSAGQWDPTTGKAQPVMPGVAHSGLLGDASVGTLRSPEFDFEYPNVYLRVKGKGYARVIIDSYTMGRNNQLLFEGLRTAIDTKGQWQWVKLHDRRKLYAGKGFHRAHIEIIDDHRDSHLIVDEVRFGHAGPPPHTDADNTPVPDPVNIDFAKLTEQFQQAANQQPQPERVLAITDGSPEDSYLHIRGGWRAQGENLPRRFLTALGGEASQPSNTGSGREALADALVSPHNPLTARVQVNRLWHHLLGRGIVPTVDNLGYLGLPATHPELLDQLALTFANEDDWSNKAMIKRIVTSKAYQRSSDRTADAAEEKDPNNTLLHRQNIRRMTAETLRDSILAVAGSLNEKAFGPPVGVHLTDFMQGRGRPQSGPLDGQGRRSIYTSVRRNFLPPMMLTFDTPIPFSTVGQRNVSNVPAQSLTLMNDPFVHDQADKWANRLINDDAQDSNQRIERMFLAAIGRTPNDTERDAAASFLQHTASQLNINSENILRDARPWRELAHAIFNLKAFVFVR